ncbi:unnamed protein product [Meloidogyne enterolobii]|uniref:Uncharacterized protein n=1 Tax=Meloidogyne enterolobii TaxID=390850 RepID=A0ACB0ZNL9_MELEN
MFDDHTRDRQSNMALVIIILIYCSMLDRQLAYFHERKTGLCMLLENRRKLAESIALKFPSDDIFKNLKYKTKEEIICKDNNKISEILKKHSNIIYEIAFMVFDKYIMEKRTSFKEMLL